MKLIDAINKHRKGQGLAYSGDAIKHVKLSRIPSGIFSLDFLTGGGIPEDRFTIFEGMYSSGKTTVAMLVANEYHKLYPDREVLYLDVEGTLEQEWASKILLTHDNLTIYVPAYGEEGVDTIIKAVEDSNEIGLVVIDSLAMFIPTDEVKKDVDDVLFGQQSKLIARLLRKLHTILLTRRQAKKPVTILAINQLRANISKSMSKSYYDQHIKPGGHLQDFIAALDLRFSLRKTVKSTSDLPEKRLHEFVILKNKLGMPQRIGSFYLVVSDHDGLKAGQIDDFEVVVDFAQKAGVIARSGGWIIQFAPDDIYPEPFKKKDDLVLKLQSDRALFDLVKLHTLAACLLDPAIGGNAK